MKNTFWQQTFGWIAVALSSLIAVYWAFWGIIENFHEGWYYDSLPRNLELMFVQYLCVAIFFMIVAPISVCWPRVGSVIHFLLGLYALNRFRGSYRAAIPFIVFPFILLGLLYWFGRPLRHKLVYTLVIGLPLLTILVCGAYPAYRVANRIDDGNRGARLIEGNGVRLIWAPAGPGWPSDGVTWGQANQICQNLSEDGLTESAEPRNIWRLPSAEEAVRSMCRHGKNSGGTWDSQTATASYEIMPDKESPLWDMHSKVVYWWTATSVDDQQAFIIVYGGQVWPREKHIRPGYLAFRCVKS